MKYLFVQLLCFQVQKTIYNYNLSLTVVFIFKIFIDPNAGWEEGQPQQLLARATFSSFSRPNPLEILVLRLLCVEKFLILEDKTIF